MFSVLIKCPASPAKANLKMLLRSLIPAINVGLATMDLFYHSPLTHKVWCLQKDANFIDQLGLLKSEQSQ